jgi:hypothetical protein
MGREKAYDCSVCCRVCRRFVSTVASSGFDGGAQAVIAIWIEPHERSEATDAYRDRLSAEQIKQIEDAEDGALIQLQMNICGDPTINRVLIIPEG